MISLPGKIPSAYTNTTVFAQPIPAQLPAPASGNLIHHFLSVLFCPVHTPLQIYHMNYRFFFLNTGGASQYIKEGKKFSSLAAEKETHTGRVCIFSNVKEVL